MIFNIQFCQQGRVTRTADSHCYGPVSLNAPFPPSLLEKTGLLRGTHDFQQSFDFSHVDWVKSH